MAKKIVKKILDKTNLDEKLVAEYKENKSMYDLILCYIKCYGGYIVAIGAGCTMGVSWKWALALLIGAGVWAYFTTCNCRLCKGGESACCKN